MFVFGEWCGIGVRSDSSGRCFGEDLAFIDLSSGWRVLVVFIRPR